MKITKEVKLELLNRLKMDKLFGYEYIEQFNVEQYSAIKNNLPSSLEKLNEHVLNCSLCSLSKTKKSISFYKGNENSKILLISLHDNLDTKKEFNYFKDILNDVAKIDINDIYMTNILKCNVSNYKNNLDDEIHQCIHYLEQQITLIKPNIIITLGNAFKYILNCNDLLTDVSGNLYSYRGIKLIPLLGIDFISKNPSYKDKMFKDMSKIKNIMDKK